MKICFFIGHREAPQTLFSALQATVERHIRENDVGTFIVGHYGAFDRMAAQAVILEKKRYPHIRLLLLLPYHPAAQAAKFPAGFDGSWYPEGMETVPKRYAILRANRLAVDSTDFLIAYVSHSIGNSGAVLEYAQRRGIPVTNLGALH